MTLLPPGSKFERSPKYLSCHLFYGFIFIYFRLLLFFGGGLFVVTWSFLFYLFWGLAVFHMGRFSFLEATPLFWEGGQGKP